MTAGPSRPLSARRSEEEFAGNPDSRAAYSVALKALAARAAASTPKMAAAAAEAAAPAPAAAEAEAAGPTSHLTVTGSSTWTTTSSATARTTELTAMTAMHGRFGTLVLPVELVDRARMGILANKDPEVFARAFMDDAQHELETSRKKGSVELYVADKLQKLRAEAAQRRNRDRYDRGDFLRAADGLRLLGEILQEAPRPGNGNLIHNDDYSDDNGDDGMDNVPGSERMNPTAGLAQLLHSRATLADADRILGRRTKKQLV